MFTLVTLIYGAVGLAVGYYASRLDGMIEYRVAGFVVVRSEEHTSELQSH